jgi:hypothetical protein
MSSEDVQNDTSAASTAARTPGAMRSSPLLFFLIFMKTISFSFAP